MAFYRIYNKKVCIGLVSEGVTLASRIIDAPPFAKWSIGHRTQKVLEWFRGRGYTVEKDRGLRGAG